MRNNIFLFGALCISLLFLNSDVSAETVCCEPDSSCYPCTDWGLGDVGCVWVGPYQNQYCCDCITGVIECQPGDTRCHPYDDDILQDCYDGTWHGYMTCLSGCFAGECLPLPPACGDGVCDSDENCENCPEDCGTCPPEEFPDIDEFKPAEVTVGLEKVTVTLYLRNDDVIDMPGDNYLIEVQPRDIASGLSAWVGTEQVCNPNHPENVHRNYEIDAGETIQFDITCPVDAGTYDIYLLSTDGCCVDSTGNPIPCSFTDPYGSGKFIGTVNVGAEGDVNVHQTKRSYKCDDEVCVYTDSDEIKEYCENGCKDGKCIVNPEGTISLEMISVILAGSLSVIAIIGLLWWL